MGRTAVVNRTKTFQTAVCFLNSLHNRAAQAKPGMQLQAMPAFLHRMGIPVCFFEVGELDQLNIIHVTGTKGKGSTCAFTERILRNYGFHTGFYSSPHLVHVRERIRINGQPISEPLFNKYFWEAQERLEDAEDPHGGSVPFYFQFLTLLAFHVFLQEKVDVAVIEVGIGGQHDCTNIIRKPWACGVTSLGLDHCGLLGDTVEEIARQKAGIFKPGVPAFTVRQQPRALRVLQGRAAEIRCPLWVTPELDLYEAATGPLNLGLAGKHQRSNASLALQLTHCWLQRHKAEQRKGGPLRSFPTSSKPGSPAAPFQPSAAMLRGLQDTEWAGRNQSLQHGSVTYYLDGAHTAASMQACVCWFTQEMLHRGCTHHGVKILLFNTTGERDSAALLKLLLPCRFDVALFCPSISETAAELTVLGISDVTALRHLSRCRENHSSWCHLNAAEPTDDQHRHLVASSASRSLVFPCIPSALQWIGQGEQLGLEGSAPPSDRGFSSGMTEASNISVLVTGSLHLVGGVLKHLEST